ncbi:hypothetical protein LTR53_000723 [Teratosphaeriaceae sp. CCFEE 6253]|nr:hypothetical protein LTR53_000723 [Teratosphaeriaceae sp. CCFEE 6253]
MFMITPKHPRRAAASASEDPDKPAQAVTASTAAPAADKDRGPVRTAKACETCRIRKTKCNGQQPCSLCRRKNIVCVFPRTLDRDMPISTAKANLLQHQQRRLYTAVQRMASVIAKLETRTEADHSSFDVLEQLDKYAPVSEDPGDEEPDSLQHEGARPPKRPRNDGDAAPTSTTDCSQNFNPPSDEQFIQNQAPMLTNGHTSNEAYESVMQFLRNMSNGSGAQAGATLERMNPAEPLAPALFTNLSNGNGIAQPVASLDYSGPAPLPQSESLPLELATLIDWEASLANFQRDGDPFSYDTYGFGSQPDFAP